MKTFLTTRLAAAALASLCFIPLGHSRETVYSCQSEARLATARSIDGIKWSANLEGSSTEAGAREEVRQECRYRFPWKDRLTGVCSDLAKKAACEELQPLTCVGQARLRDPWNRPGRIPTVETIRLGIVYVPVTLAESDLATKNWYSKFCPTAISKRFLGYFPAESEEGFCAETLATLRCGF